MAGEGLGGWQMADGGILLNDGKPFRAPHSMAGAAYVIWVYSIATRLQSRSGFRVFKLSELLVMSEAARYFKVRYISQRNAVEALAQRILQS